MTKNKSEQTKMTNNAVLLKNVEESRSFILAQKP